METKESALILACLRAHYRASSSADLIGRVRDGIAPRKVLSTARRHGIVPLVYEGLKASRLPDSAANTARVLQREFRQSAANSFLYAAELVRLSKYLAEHGIATLAFKGPTLAALLYGKLSLRTVRDLDLLVGKEHMQPALDALRHLGYTPAAGSDGASPSVSSDIRKHILLIHPVLGFSVELHWALSDPSFVFPLCFEELWVGQQMITIMDQSIPTLSREHLLLMMCAHGTNHCWGSLKWICDIAQAVLVFHDLDWNRLSARARALGCHRMLLVGLQLAKEICGVQLPRELASRVRSEKVDQICREVQAHLFAEREPAVSIERTLKFVQSRERFLDRIRILSRFIGRELRPRPGDFYPFRIVRILLFRWNRAILPILQGTIDSSAPIRPE